MDNLIQQIGDGLGGRSGRQQFWVRFLILVFGSAALIFVLGLFGLPTFISSFITLPLWLYIAARRLHDLGLPSWLGLIPFASGVAVGVASHLPLPDEISTPLIGLAPGVVTLAMVLWLGCARGQPEPNRYGLPPGHAPADVF